METARGIDTATTPATEYKSSSIGTARSTLKESVVSNHLTRQEIIDNLLNLARQEHLKGNSSITADKLNKLQSVLEEKSAGKKKKNIETKLQGRQNIETKLQGRQNIETKLQGKKNIESQFESKYNKYQRVPDLPGQVRSQPHPKPKYPPLFDKFDLSRALKKQPSPPLPSPPPRKAGSPSTNKDKKSIKYYKPRKFTFRQVENMAVNVLENIANLLDNLHLLSNLPMFPQFLTKLLKQTNKLWVLILIFLIRKTISQLLNVIRKIRKVNIEKEILNSKSVSKSIINQDINKKYDKVLRDLKFDKMMLVIELVGNFLDLTFNAIELYGLVLPDWIMSGLNFASMAMTIYRMNKDDEYLDDDITEDLI